MSGVANEEEMRKRFGLGIAGAENGGGVKSGLQADVLGNIEHDRIAGGGGGGGGNIGPIAPSFGMGLGGGLMGGFGSEGAVGKDKIAEEKMVEEEEEL